MLNFINVFVLAIVFGLASINTIKAEEVTDAPKTEAAVVTADSAGQPTTEEQQKIKTNTLMEEDDEADIDDNVVSGDDEEDKDSVSGMEDEEADGTRRFGLDMEDDEI